MSLLQFDILRSFSWLRHGFTLRVEGVDVSTNRSAALGRLQAKHQEILAWEGVWVDELQLAEQVHQAEVAQVASRSSHPIRGVDGLVTASPGLALGIHVADCCAVFLVETQRRAIGLLHSGKKGTEKNIAGEGVEKLLHVARGNARNVVAVLSPCIHACCYETDFVSEIEIQLRSKGVESIHRSPDCTGCNLQKHYSYRKEKGQTGRSLAFVKIVPEIS